MNAIEQIKAEIEKLYGISVTGKYVVIENTCEDVIAKMDQLRAVVEAAVPSRTLKDEGKPLLVLNVKGYDPFSGYMVVITTSALGKYIRRYPTMSEAAGVGCDMW